MSGVDPIAAARLRIKAVSWGDYEQGSCIAGSRATYEGTEAELVAAGLVDAEMLEWLGDRQMRSRNGDYGNHYRLQRFANGRLRLTIETLQDPRMPRYYRRDRKWEAAGEAVARWLRSKGWHPAIDGR